MRDASSKRIDQQRAATGGNHVLSVERIEAAANRILSAIYESPLVYSETLSGLTGNAIYLKLENL